MLGENETPNASKIEAVRDLIFGQDIAELNARLDEIRQKMSENRQNTQQDLENAKSRLLQSIESMEKNIMQRIDMVQNATEQELKRQQDSSINKESLGGLFLEFSQRLSSR